MTETQKRLNRHTGARLALHSRRTGRIDGAVVVAILLLLLVVGGLGYRFVQDQSARTPADSNAVRISQPPVDEPSRPAGPSANAEQKVTRIVETEDWILQTTTELPRLARGVMNLRLPDIQCEDMFADDVKVVGLQAGGQPKREFNIADLGVYSQKWPVKEMSHSGTPANVGLWKSLFSQISYFERAKFYFVRAAYRDGKDNQIDADVNFDGVARALDGSLMHIKGKQKITWQEAEGEEGHWQIVGWKQKSLNTTHRDDTFFRDVVHQVIPQELHEQLRESPHERLVAEIASSAEPQKPHRYFSPHASDRHPSVSVVDIDRDGFDDLYVMARWGKNLMFRNRGNGTFEEIAAEIGLDIEDHCSSAIFADFDNDGDSDVFIGRTLERSMFLENENGKFVDRTSSHVSTDMPKLVFSVSAADYNNDGLMDVLFCTYAQETQYMSRPNPRTKRWLDDFLSPEQAEYLYSLRGNHFLLARPGPPNVLLVNRGDRQFDLAPESEQVAAWRQSTQGTWSDIDDDGDLDLYMTNDFSINTMFRNDGDAGFVDITDSTQTADIGFGMGVSWGDYDLDGHQDLYVSNMFSKAGQRITSQLEAGDERFAAMARGNSLFRKEDEKFRKVSGLTESALHVEMAGWSWGGQFVDIDNNGYLDIYALSGFYTAPKQFALPGDL